jgi:hypothetical protein
VRNDPHPIASLSRRSLTGNVLFSVGQTGLRFVVSLRRCCVRVPVFEYGSMTVCQRATMTVCHCVTDTPVRRNAARC